MRVVKANDDLTPGESAPAASPPAQNKPMGEIPDWVRADIYARRADDEADTAASETAMAVASDAVLAWSDDDDADEPERASWRVVCGRAAAVLAGCLMAAGLVVLAWRELAERSPENAPVAESTTRASAPAPTTTEPAPPLPATTGSVAQKITPRPCPLPIPTQNSWRRWTGPRST